jgi:fatty acid desaturase
MPPAPTLTDPTYTPHALGPFSRFAMRWIHDERDLPMVWFLALAGAVVGGGAVLLYWPGMFRWWLAGAYLAVTFGAFLARFTLLLHNICHRPLFKREHWWMGRLIPWLWGPLFGQTPESFFVHHVGMHHPENNLEPDASSTLEYQRDSFLAFLRYWSRFMLFGWTDLTRYFQMRGKKGLLRRLWVGEVAYLSLVALLFWVNWRATVVVLGVPFFLIRFLMMAGNWGQHAFIDASDPNNPYKNSITCINSPYNQRCFNDGYHIGHHIKMNRHWSEMPEDFARNVDEYAREGAIVFEGLDNFSVWLLLMLGRYDWLAKRYVDLSDTKKSPAEITALLQERTRPICSPAASVGVAA